MNLTTVHTWILLRSPVSRTYANHYFEGPDQVLIGAGPCAPLRMASQTGGFSSSRKGRSLPATADCCLAWKAAAVHPCRFPQMQQRTPEPIGGAGERRVESEAAGRHWLPQSCLIDAWQHRPLAEIAPRLLYEGALKVRARERVKLGSGRASVRSPSSSRIASTVSCRASRTSSSTRSKFGGSSLPGLSSASSRSSWSRYRDARRVYYSALGDGLDNGVDVKEVVERPLDGLPRRFVTVAGFVDLARCL